MNFLSRKRRFAGVFLCFFLSALLFFSNTAESSDVKKLEDKSSNLEDQLKNINQDLLNLSNQIAEVENEIEDTGNQISQTQEQLAIAKNREADQYQDMKLRIKYMYENDSVSMLEVLFAARSMKEFLNGVEFIRNISEYDRTKLDDLHELKVIIADQEKELQKKQDSQLELQEKLDTQEAELQKKAAETSTSLSVLKAQIQKIREEEARKAAEAARKAAEAAAAKRAEEARRAAEAKKAAEASRNTGQDVSASAPSVQYDMPSGDGVLTKHKGVNYYKGHRETYYSQRVLPGGGLNIPGRHVASDGTIRDKDNYICVASTDYPKGTVVETSLGPAKVYDSGCAHGTIDIYTDW